MNLSQLNTNTIRQILKLSEKKESLLKELNKIETTIESLFKGNTTSPITPKNPKASSTTQPKALKAKKRAPKAQRGMIKESIMQALKEAGPIGMKVNDLSKKLGIKSANLHVWFSNVGKKIEGLERIAPGHFRLHHKQPAQAPAEQKIEQSSMDLKKDSQEDLPL